MLKLLKLFLTVAIPNWGEDLLSLEIRVGARYQLTASICLPEGYFYARHLVHGASSTTALILATIRGSRRKPRVDLNPGAEESNCIFQT